MPYMVNTHPERIARLETKLEHIEQAVMEIRATQLEIRDTLVSVRAVGSAAKSGLSFLQAVYPPVSALVAALLAMRYGLPRI